MLSIGKNHIDLRSFFQRGVRVTQDPWGVVLINGYMGSGKTYFSVYLLAKVLPQDLEIVTNVHSLKIPGRKIRYFQRVEEITEDFGFTQVFLIDEISKKYTKDSKQDVKFYSWLQQSRKVKRIVILITQEYLQTPAWLRCVARTVYTTNKVPFVPLFYTIKGHAELNETFEWTVVPEERFFYKRTKSIARLYDTFEPVPTL